MHRRPLFLLILATLLVAGCSTAITGASRKATPRPAKARASHPPSRPAHPTATQRPNASGLLTTADVSRATCGSSGRVVRFRIGVEQGLQTTPAAFGNAVRNTLCDGRSWIGSGAVRFRYDPNGPLLISLRSASGTERRCLQLIGLSVNLTYSCGTSREVVINAARWFGGSPAWPGGVSDYRRMVTNHETGHALGLGHRNCPEDGAPAPVMMQQSKGLTFGGHTCVPNPWPLADEKERLS